MYCAEIHSSLPNQKLLLYGLQRWSVMMWCKSHQNSSKNNMDDGANMYAFEYVFQAELISNEYSPYIGAIEMEELGGWMVVTGLKKAEST